MTGSGPGSVSKWSQRVRTTRGTERTTGVELINLSDVKTQEVSQRLAMMHA